MIVRRLFWLYLLIGPLVEFGCYVRAEPTLGTHDQKTETLKEEANDEPEEEELTGGIQTDQVLIRGLNKVTAHISDIVAPVGQKAKFGSLEITARLCQKSPPEDPPESTAYLEIQEVKPDEKPSSLFSGWMFASSPDISALEHPVYDIWVLNCQGQVVHELPAIEKGSSSLSIKDISAQSQELLPKTPTIEAFNRGFNHS